MTADWNPWRDNGPYQDAGQARAQYEAVMGGIPAGAAPPYLPLAEALLLAGVGGELTEYERDRLDHLGQVLDAETVQVLTGWVLRAHLGQVRQRVVIGPGQAFVRGQDGRVEVVSGQAAQDAPEVWVDQEWPVEER